MLGVTAMVALVVTALSLLHLMNLARVLLLESRARVELLANAVYHQAREVDHRSGDRLRRRAHQPQRAVGARGRDLLAGRHRRRDRRSDGHRDRVERSGAGRHRPWPRRTPLNNLIAESGLGAAAGRLQHRRSRSNGRQPIALGDQPFGEIRIGLSTLLVRRDLNQSLAPAAVAAGVALLVAVLVAMLLAQIVLRPMHVIRSSLSRLGRGDLGATLDLRDDEEFRELGDVFDQVSAQLRAASPEGLKPAQLAELSRRIAMVGRLTAGVAHEMKNPLNAMTIHLELLKQKLAAGQAGATRTSRSSSTRSAGSTSASRAS